MDSLSINSLLENLKNPNEKIREEATRKLWRIWFQQKGIYGLEMIERSQKLMDGGNIKGSRSFTHSINQRTTRLC